MRIRCDTICKIERICAQINLRQVFNVTMISQSSCLIAYRDELCLCQPSDSYCHAYFVSTIALTIVCVLSCFFLVMFLVYRHCNSASPEADSDVENESVPSKTPTQVSSVNEEPERCDQGDDGGDEERKPPVTHKSKGDAVQKMEQNVTFKRSASMSPHNKTELKAILDRLLVLAQAKEKREARTADSDVTQSSCVTTRPDDGEKDDDWSQISYRTASNIKRMLAKRLVKVRGKSAAR